jgi:hypothetical protein
MSSCGRDVPPIALRRPGRARFVWEQGARVKFHYTQPDHAELILAESTFCVSIEPGRAGHGLYATTVQPRSMSDDKLRDLLFARGRPEGFVEGVVVLRDDALSWKRYSHRKYVHPSAPGGQARPFPRSRWGRHTPHGNLAVV